MNDQASIIIDATCDEVMEAILSTPLAWLPQQTIPQLQTSLPIQIGAEWSYPDGGTYRLTEHIPPFSATFTIQNRFVERTYSYSIRHQGSQSEVTLNLRTFHRLTFHQFLSFVSERIFKSPEKRGLEKILRALKKRVEN